MNVSAITLDMLDAAVVDTLADASPAEQGQLLADLVIKFHGEATPTPKPVGKPNRTRPQHKNSASTFGYESKRSSAHPKRTRPKHYGANMYAPLRFGGRTHGKPTYR